jgi:hypothetical protein
MQTYADSDRRNFPSYMKVQLAKYQIVTPLEPVANPQPPLCLSASDILGLGCLMTISMSVPWSLKLNHISMIQVQALSL